MMSDSPIATSDGHVLHWHDTGAEFLAAELEAIVRARSSIRLESYIFTASPLGQRFREALTAAARRGVKVTLLLDDVGCIGLPRGYFREVTLAGGRVIWFNPMRWRLWTFRDHRKLLVVDEERAFIGGCNVAPEYDGDGVAEGWRDGGIDITGPAVKTLVESFESQVEKAGNEIWRARKHGHNGWVNAGEDVALLLMRPGLHQGIFQSALKRDLQGARDVAMTMAYFLPRGRFKHMLKRAARQARSFRLLLPGKSDIPMMRVATRALYSQFQSSGAEIHEYEPQVLHAKVIVVDDFVYVGSSNLDPRSLNINFEVMLRIRSPELARKARATFERDLRHSLPAARLSWRKPLNWWVRLKQKAAHFFFAWLDLGVAQLLVQKVERRAGRKARKQHRRHAQEKHDCYAHPCPPAR
ncbi:MAG: phospholipase D-like domain-containing protein [Prosthecobacter sp.]